MPRNAPECRNGIDQFETIRRYRSTDGSALVATTSQVHDDGDRLIELTHTPGQFGKPLPPAYTLRYDLDDRLTFQNALGEELNYDYDESHELRTVISSHGNDESYDFDLNGNRTDHVVGPANRLREDATYRYDYDAEGNRYRRTHLLQGWVTTYAWDHRNRLTRLTSNQPGVAAEVTFRYDVMDRRIAKTVGAVTKRFVYDGAHITLAFDNSANPTEQRLRHRYLHGPAVDQVFADEQVAGGGSPGPVNWPVTDHLGSVRILLSDSGGEVGHLRYNSFGKITEDLSAGIDFLFGYTGREEDRETGLKYYRARYYDAATGQFVGEDPIEDDSNPYRYVGNGPTNATDPTGLGPKWLDDWMDRNVGDWLGRKYNASAGFRGTVEAVDVIARAPINLAVETVQDPGGVNRAIRTFERAKQGYDAARGGGENVAGSLVLGGLLPVADAVGVTPITDAIEGKELFSNRRLSESERVTHGIVGTVQLAGTAVTIYSAPGLVNSVRSPAVVIRGGSAPVAQGRPIVPQGGGNPFAGGVPPNLRPITPQTPTPATPPATPPFPSTPPLVADQPITIQLPPGFIQDFQLPGPFPPGRLGPYPPWVRPPLWPPGPPPTPPPGPPPSVN